MKKVGRKKLKIINVDSPEGRKFWWKMARKHLKTHLYATEILVAAGRYTWKEQKNGLIRYTILEDDSCNPELVRKEILKEIAKKEQIIIMEGKNFYTVMKCPDSHLSCV